MYALLARLMVLAALAKLGSSLAYFERCDSLKCRQRLQSITNEVTRVNWRAISIFPEEAKRFR
jgi:hypothetical protein